MEEAFVQATREPEHYSPDAPKTKLDCVVAAVDGEVLLDAPSQLRLISQGLLAVEGLDHRIGQILADRLFAHQHGGPLAQHPAFDPRRQRLA